MIRLFNPGMAKLIDVIDFFVLDSILIVIYQSAADQYQIEKWETNKYTTQLVNEIFFRWFEL